MLLRGLNIAGCAVSLIFVTCAVLVSASLSIVLAKPAGANPKFDTIVAFGTSLTARASWPKGLAIRLSSCLKRDVKVSVVARSGAPSSWGAAHVDDVIKLNPDIVVIEFYINDAAINRLTSVESSGETIGEIFSALKTALPDARIIMQVMKPVSGIRGAVRPYLQSYIDAHITQAERYGLEVIDYSPEWASVSSEALAKAIPDGIHPDRQVAASIIVPKLASLIAGERCR